MGTVRALLCPAKKIVRIGTRGSLLALAQARGVQKELRKKNPGTRFEIVVIKTTGDEYQAVELFKKNKIGVFTREIEKKLLNKDVDIAVHSLKDLPTDLPGELTLAAYPKRVDARDVIISKFRYTLRTLPKNASVATGSPRRKSQLALLRPDLRLFDVRGNLDSRINRVLKKKEFDAVVLARAGLLRLKRYLKFAAVVGANQILPAVGQGALGLEARTSDADTLKMLKKLNHKPTQARVCAERSFLRSLGGGCRVPAGINSSIEGNRLRLEACVFSVFDSTGKRSIVRGAVSGPVNSCEYLGITLAQKLLSQGADKLMREARK